MRKQKIMLAMMRSSFRDELSCELSHSGFEVILAADGFEALTELRNHLIDGLVVQLNLKLFDAIELILNIKEFQNDIPIIVISFSDYNPQQQIIKAGATSFFRFPVSTKDIIRQLNKFKYLKKYRKIN